MQISINHDWTVAGPGGYFGVLEYKTGRGILDAHTGVVCGSMHFDIPVPIFVVVLLAGVVFILATFTVYARSKRHNVA